MMKQFAGKFRDLAAMVSAERDARRADAEGIRADLKAVWEAIDRRMDLADERASGFESAIIESLSGMAGAVEEQAEKQADLEDRVTKLEERLGQAS
ncbi:MAG: hypothetical protein FJZ01_08605 [Candidatus Sericytochromatia bacterium]|nr:hypothetical protein [Candidatus Tanganyikabacteria bacterium]